MSSSRLREAAETAAVATATLFLLAGFTTLFSGGRWFITVAAIVVAIAAVTAGLRMLGLRGATGVSLLAGLLVISWVFVPETTILGIPTVKTFAELGRLVADSQAVIVEEVAPLAPPESLLLVLAIAFGVLFCLADAVARQTWRAGLLALLWLTVFVVPSVISMELPPWWVFVGTAACWLLLWWLGREIAGRNAVRSGLLVATPALLAAAVLPSLGPNVEPVGNDAPVGPSTTFGVGINPMIELGKDLRRPSNRRVLTYTTDVSGGVYLKVSTLREFGGRTWRPSPLFGDIEVEGAEAIAPEIDVAEAVTDIEIKGLRSTYLPVPYPAIEITGLTGDWSWLTDGGTVRAEGSTTTAGQTYSVTSLAVKPTAEQIRAADSVAEDMDLYRRLPEGVPTIVESLAQEHAGQKSNDYDRMLALQNWMRDSFTYSVEAPVKEGYDGNGLGVMGEFLTRKSGYCVHFASTLAVMGRVLGVPTRVAVGYAPGAVISRNAKTGTVYGVNSNDLHAWTEAYFSGIGWVGFDATPGIGTGTGFESEDPAQNQTDDPANPDDPAASETERPLTPAEDAATAGGDQSPVSDFGSGLRAGLAAALALFALALGPALVRQFRRRRRFSPGASAEPLWAEVEDTAVDLGIGRLPTQTPRSFADSLIEHGADPTATGLLLTQLERERYGGQNRPTDDAVAGTHEVLSSLAAGADRRSKWRARFWPRSLFR
ncbi:MAG TPA: DUF3488 and transglutaminase-like domain-containing protein [Aeromicrobium sp.]|mgnify:CR=1 FL=1|nr:DUF3488 and transglutaminase-like domain-containing protein [Aeromicrobium sp.]